MFPQKKSHWLNSLEKEFTLPPTRGKKRRIISIFSNVNVDIFACINSREFEKMGNFTRI